MPHAKALYDWDQRLATFFPDLPPRRRDWLALVSYGIVLAQSALLSSVALQLALALGLTFNAVRQRIRKLYRPLKGSKGQDHSFDYTACFGPLLRWATAGFSDRRLVIALDPTHIGDRFTILTACVVFRSCAVPVAWDVRRADQKGSWNEQWERLLGLLHAALGGGWEVLVLTDRGLESPDLFRAITGLGWHPLMRAKKGGKFRPDGWVRNWALPRFAGRVGARWKGRGVVWPTGSKLGCTLLACWEEGYAEPWLILTDLEPASASALWYAWRGWIEQGFRDLKSDGWSLSGTRMTDAVRVARWWTACALATLWVLESGQEAQRLEVPATKVHRSEEKGAVVSLFALGWAWLVLQLGRGRLRRLRRLVQPAWPCDPGGIDALSEQDWIAEHQTVPL